jgi:predicted molibdopterin-dependent oxidoreductase YjgC
VNPSRETAGRIREHPILGPLPGAKPVRIIVDGRSLEAREGEPIAAALAAAGIWTHRYTVRHSEPRGVFCAIGHCTDCVMTVDGVANVRTCITPVSDGMLIETQRGLGQAACK